MRDLNDLFYAQEKSPLEFKFDSMVSRPLFSMIPFELDRYLYTIATDLKLNSKVKQKYQMIDDALAMYGFELLARGTNRSTYRYFYDDSIVLKVGYDKAGIHDAQREFYNQEVLKPFVTKCFEVSPSGTIGLFERVNPITYKEEFKSIAEDVFELLTKFIIGKYILADIGTDFYMNWGLRSGFGPVLLDYPFMYELDGKRLHCINQVKGPDGRMVQCPGLIDYDDGFNYLVCEKCGKKYFAQDLAKFNTSTGRMEFVRGALGGNCMPKLWKDGVFVGTFGPGDPLNPSEEPSPYTPLRAFLNGRDEEIARLNKLEQERARQIQQAAQQHYAAAAPQNRPAIEIDHNDLVNLIKSLIVEALGPDKMGLSKPVWDTQYQNPGQVFTQPTQPVQQPPRQTMKPAQQLYITDRGEMMKTILEQNQAQQQPHVLPPTNQQMAVSEVDKARKEAMQRQLRDKANQQNNRRFQESRVTPQTRMEYLFNRLKRRFGDLFCGKRINDHNLLTFYVMGALSMIYDSEGVNIPVNIKEHSIEVVNDFIKEIRDNIERKKKGNQQQAQQQRVQTPVHQPQQQPRTQAPVQQSVQQQRVQAPVQQPQQHVFMPPTQPVQQPQQQGFVFDKNNRVGNPYNDPNLNIENEVSEEVEAQFQEAQTAAEMDLEAHLEDINPTAEGEEYSATTEQALNQINNNGQQGDNSRSKF